jgi:hypothetical protein
MALAIADADSLRSLLQDCFPAIAPPDCVGDIQASIGIPMEPGQAADGVLQFESIYCRLVDSRADLEQGVADYVDRYGNHRGHLDLTRCEAECRLLCEAASIAQAFALLSHSGFAPCQIEAILNLPQAAWYKSWWYMRDATGRFTVPFLRWIRTKHYRDGRLAIYYKDFFAQEKPACFKSQTEKVLVEINTEAGEFRRTLHKINMARQQLGIDRAILISDRLSDLEAQAFISQGISIYAATDLALPAQANCTTCTVADCPMQGLANSPVLMCRRFGLPSRPATPSSGFSG